MGWKIKTVHETRERSIFHTYFAYFSFSPSFLEVLWIILIFFFSVDEKYGHRGKSIKSGATKDKNGDERSGLFFPGLLLSLFRGSSLFFPRPREENEPPRPRFAEILSLGSCMSEAWVSILFRNGLLLSGGNIK
jgi:hypothetical protein